MPIYLFLSELENAIQNALSSGNFSDPDAIIGKKFVFIGSTFIIKLCDLARSENSFGGQVEIYRNGK